VVKILITGGTGFVGTNIVKRAIEKGTQLKCLVRSEKKARTLKDFGVETIEGDILQPETLDAAMRGVSGVIHLVGIIAEAGDSTFERIHFEGTKIVVDAVKKAGIKRYIHMSALGVRAGALSRYSQTKWQAEDYVRSTDLNYTIFRPSVIYGKKDGFLNLFAKQIRFSPLVPIVGSGKTLFQPIWVEDVAECFLRSFENEKTIRKEYELVGLDRLSMEEMIDGIILSKKTWRLKIHLPIPFMKVNAFIFEKLLPRPPITRDQLVNLEEDNIGDPDPMMKDFGIEPKRVVDYMDEIFGKQEN
jgi:NADH dehydrogenase